MPVSRAGGVPPSPDSSPKMPPPRSVESGDDLVGLAPAATPAAGETDSVLSFPRVRSSVPLPDAMRSMSPASSERPAIELSPPPVPQPTARAPTRKQKASNVLGCRHLIAVTPRRRESHLSPDLPSRDRPYRGSHSPSRQTLLSFLPHKVPSKLCLSTLQACGPQ